MSMSKQISVIDGNYDPPEPSQSLIQLLGTLPFLDGKARELTFQAILEQMKRELVDSYSAGIALGAESTLAEFEQAASVAVAPPPSPKGAKG